MNNSGKALTVFLIVIAILLISLTAISLFFLLQEIEVGKELRSNLEQTQIKEQTLTGSLEEAKKNIFILEEQKKDADEEIESPQGELDLVQGLREEIQKENSKLLDNLEIEKQTKVKIREDLNTQIVQAKERVTALEQEIKSAVDRNKELETQRQELKDKYQGVVKQLGDLGYAPSVDQPMEPEGEASLLSEEALPMIEENNPEEMNENVELGKIVVTPQQEGKGKIISVDKETDFVILDLGEKDGVNSGTVLSVFRGKAYLGDVKVSRVLPEMSAADFLPPLKSQSIRKDDQVVIKK